MRSEFRSVHPLLGAPGAVHRLRAKDERREAMASVVSSHVSEARVCDSVPGVGSCGYIPIVAFPNVMCRFL